MYKKSKHGNDHPSPTLNLATKNMLFIIWMNNFKIIRVPGQIMKRCKILIIENSLLSSKTLHGHVFSLLKPKKRIYVFYLNPPRNYLRKDKKFCPGLSIENTFIWGPALISLYLINNKANFFFRSSGWLNEGKMRGRRHTFYKRLLSLLNTHFHPCSQRW